MFNFLFHNIISFDLELEFHYQVYLVLITNFVKYISSKFLANPAVVHLQMILLTASSDN